MSETKTTGEKTLTVASKTLSLKRPVEAGVVKQSFTHGRSKTVVVEKVKRHVARPGETAPAAPAPVTESIADIIAEATTGAKASEATTPTQVPVADVVVAPDLAATVPEVITPVETPAAAPVAAPAPVAEATPVVEPAAEAANQNVSVPPVS